MRPVAIRARGFRSFADLDITLPDGCTAVVGANGAGKSSLIAAVELALFGPEGRSLEPYATEGGDGELLVEVEVDHAGESYRVRRQWSARGRGKSTLDLEERHLDEEQGYDWEPLTEATAADTQRGIEAILGLSRETFRGSAYLAQGDGAVFTDAKPADRKRLLADALGLSLWEHALTHVGVDRRTMQQTVTRLDGRVALLGEQAGDTLEAEIQTKTLALELGVCEEDLADAAAAVTAHEVVLRAEQLARQQWETRVQAHRHAQQLASAQRQLGVQAQVARERLDGERTQMRSLERLEDERRGLAVVVEEKRTAARAAVLAAETIERYEAEADQLTRRLVEQQTELGRVDGKLEALTRPGTVCDRCGQEMDQAAKSSARASRDDERVKVHDVIVQTQTAIVAAHTAAAQVEIPPPVDGLADEEQRLAELASATANLAAAQARIAELEQTARLLDDDGYKTDLGRLEREAKQAQDAVDDLGPPDPDAQRRITAHLTEARADHARITGERDRLRVLQAQAEAALRQHERTAADLEQTRDQRATAAADLDQLTTLERAFGRDGVPAWIVEQQAIPAVEAEANRILAELGGAVSRVELRTERDLKGGGTREALDIVCLTDAGARDYGTFSGGERCRVDVALRLGLARLLAGRRGAEIRWLALDEPEALDEQGMQALAGVLRGLVQDGVVDSVLLASHIPALREAFDATLLVSRNGAGSTVEAT